MKTKPDPHYPPSMTDHRPVRAAVAVRAYDAVNRVVYGEREVLCPDGLRRILADEGYCDLGPLDVCYAPYTEVVENLNGKYMVAR